MQHTARVKCGKCGHEADIALGHAYSIECIGCKTEIVLGEEEMPTLEDDMTDMTVDIVVYVVLRDNEPDLKFEGEILGSVNNEHPDCGGRWTELTLYRTTGGKFVCEREHFTCWQGERDTSTGIVADTEAEVIDFFGHGSLAKELYAIAGIEDVTKVA